MILFVIAISAITTNTQLRLNQWALSSTAGDSFFLYIQLILNGLKVVITLILAWVLLVSRLFQSIHDDMVRSLLFSPLSYFERVPTEKIISRLSTDLGINDKIITNEFGQVMTYAQMVLAYLFGIIYVYIIFHSYYSIVFIALSIAIAFYIYNQYFTLNLRTNKM